MKTQGRVVAVLGPTNTGKTTYAIERMLGHRTGIIGLPLRLLAREVYDRIVKARGPSVVALVTGEERIVPPRAQYWVCTVEAMPEGMGADFVAIDEFAIQKLAGQRILQLLLDRALQRSCAEGRVVALVHDLLPGGIREFDLYVAVIQTLSQVIQLNIDNLPQVLFAEHKFSLPICSPFVTITHEQGIKRTGLNT